MLQFRNSERPFRTRTIAISIMIHNIRTYTPLGMYIYIRKQKMYAYTFYSGITTGFGVRWRVLMNFAYVCRDRLSVLGFRERGTTKCTLAVARR